MVFKYVKYFNLIEASAVSTEWYFIAKTSIFTAKLKETNQFFLDKDWLLNIYKKHFIRFRDNVYWDILNVLQHEKVFIVESEIFGRMLYSVLPFCDWCHFWCCCRSQYNPDICQFCTKLQIKDKIIVKYIKKKLVLAAKKRFPIFLRSTVTFNSEIPLFVHVQCGPDRQRSYSKNNYGVLYYEFINSPFMLFKNYLDILGKIILNQCDKYLLPALCKGENEQICRRHTACSVKNCFPIKKRRITQFVYLSAVKLIKRLAVTMCQTVNSNTIPECYDTYTLWNHYRNPYLTIDCPQEIIEDNE